MRINLQGKWYNYYYPYIAFITYIWQEINLLVAQCATYKHDTKEIIRQQHSGL